MQQTLFLRGVRLTGELPKGSYLCRLPAVLHLKKTGGLDFSRPATIFVGENGTGKSTLLEALAVAVGCNPEGGSKNFAFSSVSTHSPLYAALTAVRGARRERDAFFLRAESFYNASSYVDEIAEDGPSKEDFLAQYGGRSLHAWSHGESFLALVQHRFRPGGLYFLDEPEAALSPMRLLTLLCELNALIKAGAQFFLATHSPILMALPGAQLLELTESGICEAAYETIEHVQITKRFLNDPQGMLRRLLGD